MAAITLKAAAADILANAATLAGTASNITTAQYTALANFLDILANRRGEAWPILHLLSDTDKAQLSLNE